ncbi:hypothetical protein [Variovorax sp. RA8]|nr:hypothetical protein [Variovorax sp. RA8]
MIDALVKVRDTVEAKQSLITVSKDKLPWRSHHDKYQAYELEDLPHSVAS